MIRLSQGQRRFIFLILKDLVSDNNIIIWILKFYLAVQYSQASSRDEKRNLFLVLFDYVLYQINEACLASGVSAYVYFSYTKPDETVTG